MGKYLKVLGLLSAILLLGFSAASAADVVQLTLATGGTAGTYYPLGGAIGQIISQRTGVVNITAQATGASVENMNLLAAGDVDLALTQNDIADYAWNGTEFFKKPIKNFRAIARLYPEHIQVATYADSPINSIADFKGHKISVGAPGSGNEANARQILEVYGLTYKDIQPLFLSYAETADHFKDRLMDAFTFTTGAPNSAIQDICSLIKIKFIEIKDEKRDELMKKYPFFAREVIKAGTYGDWQNKDVETVAVQAILVVREDLPEDVVYNVTRGLFENLDEIRQAHYKANDITLERAVEAITVPFHPGAIKYYKEAGIWKE